MVLFWNNYRGSYSSVISKQGIGSKLLQLAKDNTTTMLYFASQPAAEKFYEKNDYQKNL